MVVKTVVYLSLVLALSGTALGADVTDHVVQCVSGECCMDGYFASEHVICRAPRHVCDQSEFCTGSSNVCPQNSNSTVLSLCEIYGGLCSHDVCYPALAEQRISCPKDCSHHGVCDKLTGVCSCEKGYSPPDCASPVNPSNQTEAQLVANGLNLVDNMLRRMRRGVHKDSHKHHKAVKPHHKHAHAQAYAPRPPMYSDAEGDILTRFYHHHLFFPISFTIGAGIILAVFITTALCFHRSQLKKERIQGMIKVEQKSRMSEHDPLNVSKITDPAVSIDVGN